MKTIIVPLAMKTTFVSGIYVILIVLIIPITVGFRNSGIILIPQQTANYVDSRDGKSYNTVKIGNQWIMSENFAYKPNTGQFWAYNNDTNNVAEHGYLYDFETACNIAPAGWHLPSKDEWITLRKSLGGKLETWSFMEKVYVNMVDGGNSGFNAILSGILGCNGKFIKFGEETVFWSSTRNKDGMISVYGLNSNKIKNHRNGRTAPYAFRNDYQPSCCGYSVRLFKN